eukprot:570548-Rhodomonas_salina.2
MSDSMSERLGIAASRWQPSSSLQCVMGCVSIESVRTASQLECTRTRAQTHPRQETVERQNASAAPQPVHTRGFTFTSESRDKQSQPHTLDSHPTTTTPSLSLHSLTITFLFSLLYSTLSRSSLLRAATPRPAAARTWRAAPLRLPASEETRTPLAPPAPPAPTPP